jgi:hypothetical protein
LRDERVQGTCQTLGAERDRAVEALPPRRLHEVCTKRRPRATDVAQDARSAPISLPAQAGRSDAQFPHHSRSWTACDAQPKHHVRANHRRHAMPEVGPAGKLQDPRRTRAFRTPARGAAAHAWRTKTATPREQEFTALSDAERAADFPSLRSIVSCVRRDRAPALCANARPG